MKPNAKTHKTIRVFATMETDLELDINVPINLDNDEIWEFITDGNIDGADMSADECPCSGDWTWDKPCYEMEFDPNAMDAIAPRAGHHTTTARFFLHELGIYKNYLLDYIMVSQDLKAKAGRWQIWHPI